MDAGKGLASPAFVAPIAGLSRQGCASGNPRVQQGQFYIAVADGEPAGAMRFQLEDTLFWPDLPGDHTSAFVHRLVVRRQYKGQGISTALLRWAIDHARVLGRSHLRLDCDKTRPKLMALYESVGFQLHSFRQVGPLLRRALCLPAELFGLNRRRGGDHPGPEPKAKLVPIAKTLYVSGAGASIE